MKTYRDISTAIMADAARAVALAKTAADLSQEAAELAARAAAGAALLAQDTDDDDAEKAARRPASTSSKALGRALAALGFGTQFCEDYDFAGGREDKVVDAPVAPPRASGEITRIPVEPRRVSESPRPAVRENAPVSAASRATEPQVKAIFAIARSAQSMDEAQTTEWCRSRYGVPPSELTRRQASELIDALKLGQAS